MSFLSSLANIASGVERQINPFDHGATYSNPNPVQAKQQLAQAQAPVVNSINYGAGIPQQAPQRFNNVTAHPQPVIQATPTHYANPYLGTVQAIGSKIGDAAQTAQQKVESPQFKQQVHQDLHGIPLATGAAKLLNSLIINPALQGTKNLGHDIGGQNVYHGSTLQQLGQMGGDVLNTAGLVAAPVKAAKGIKEASLALKLLHGAKTGAKVGAVYGGAQGLTSSVGNGDSLKQTAINTGIGTVAGGLTGAGLGVATPLAGAAVKQGIKGAKFVAKDIKDTFSVPIGAKTTQKGIPAEMGGVKLPGGGKEPNPSESTGSSKVPKPNETTPQQSKAPQNASGETLPVSQPNPVADAVASYRDFIKNSSGNDSSVANQNHNQNVLKSVYETAAQHYGGPNIVRDTRGNISGYRSLDGQVHSNMSSMQSADNKILSSGKFESSITPAEPPKSSPTATTGGPVKPPIEPPVRQQPTPPEGPAPKERGFTTSLKNSQNTSPELKAVLSSSYTPATNKEALANTEQFMKQGITKAHQSVLERLSSTNQPDKQLVTDAGTIMQHLDAKGKTAEASTIHDLLAQKLTQSGQTSQAAALLLKRNPEGLFYGAMKDLKNAGVEVTPQIEKDLQALKNAMKKTLPGTQNRFEAVQAMNKYVHGLVPSKVADKAFTLWRTGLLTGPQTVSKILLSHSVMNAMEKAKDVPATFLDKLISLKSGQRSTALTMRGTLSGAKEGAKAGARLIKTGVDTQGTSGFSGAPEFARNLPHYKTPGLTPYVRFVNDVHAGLPKMFFNSAKENDLYKQAIAAAKTQNVPRAERDKFVNDFLKNPSSVAQEEAKLSGAKATFQQETLLGKQATKLRSAPGFKVLMPFAHIATSILTDVTDYAPTGFGKAVYQAVKENGKEGWTPTVQKHFVEELGRSIVGTGAIGMGYLLYKSGLLTLGYPSKDPKEVAQWKLNGKQENSIYLNGQWRKLDALGPVGTVLSMGGYAAQAGTSNSKGSQATAALAGMIKNISGQSYLSGLTSAANAVNDPQSAAGTFIKSEASSVIPTIVGTVARATDPQQRQTNGVAEAIASKIPGLRETLPGQVDAFGRPLQRQGSVIENLIDPTRPSGDTGNTLTPELNRLDNAGSNATPTYVKTIGTGKNAVKLTPDQQTQSIKLVGPQIQLAYSQIMKDPSYQALSDPNKQAALQNAASDLKQVNNVKTLLSLGKTQQAQSAYSGLSANQKAMYNGQPSVKDYTALDSNGKTINTAKVDPMTKYQQAVTSYQQQKNAGLLTPEKAFQTQKALNTLKIQSNYPQEVVDLYGFSKSDLNNFIQQNPDKQNLVSQVLQLDSQLATAKGTKTKFGGTIASKSGSGSRGNKGTRSSSSGYSKISLSSPYRVSSGLTGLHSKVTKSTIKSPRAIAYQGPKSPKVHLPKVSKKGRIA